MAVTANGVDIGVDEQFWQISGDTLATFRKSKLLQGGGTRFPINIMSVGDIVYWIRYSPSRGGHLVMESSVRQSWNDLAGLTLSASFIRDFYKSKLFNWIYILDAVQSIMYLYNLDLNQWNTPWKF